MDANPANHAYDVPFVERTIVAGLPRNWKAELLMRAQMNHETLNQGGINLFKPTTKFLLTDSRFEHPIVLSSYATVPYLMIGEEHHAEQR